MKKNISYGSAMDRRKFLEQSIKTIGGTALLSIPLLSEATSYAAYPASYTVQQVIDLIIKDIPGAPFPKTVDTIKFGSPDSIVTGIVTTMFPTVAVIEEAIQLKANLIIAHEPTYYNGQDNTEWVPNNQIIREKQDLLEKHKITIWRFHDYCHSMKPDMVAYGVLKKMGWLNYYTQGATTISIPPVKLEHLVNQFKTNLSIKHLRVIGDLSQTCTVLGILPGSVGGQRQIKLVEDKKPDVLILGEQVEWETTEYIRDSRRLGHPTSMIVLGHSVSEEPGMESFAEWLSPKLSGLPVKHVASGDPYIWL